MMDWLNSWIAIGYSLMTINLLVLRLGGRNPMPTGTFVIGGIMLWPILLLAVIIAWSGALYFAVRRRVSL